MFAHGMRKVLAGITTMEEVMQAVHEV